MLARTKRRQRGCPKVACLLQGCCGGVAGRARTLVGHRFPVRARGDLGAVPRLIQPDPRAQVGGVHVGVGEVALGAVLNQEDGDVVLADGAADNCAIGDGAGSCGPAGARGRVREQAGAWQGARGVCAAWTCQQTPFSLRCCSPGTAQERVSRRFASLHVCEKQAKQLTTRLAWCHRLRPRRQEPDTSRRGRKRASRTGRAGCQGGVDDAREETGA